MIRRESRWRVTGTVVRPRSSRIAICSMALLLVAPGIAQAEKSPPYGYGDVRVTGPTTATLSGDVHPGGQPTTYRGIYDFASSRFCSSNAQKGAARFRTASRALGGTNRDYRTVAIDLTKLTGGAHYCAVLESTNRSGTGGITEVVADVIGAARFTAGGPEADTGTVLVTGATTALVTGLVNPMGQSATVRAVYAQARPWSCGRLDPKALSASTPRQPVEGADRDFHRVSVTVTGLAPGADYCVAIQAINGSGSAIGEQSLLTAGRGRVTTERVSSGDGTTATVTGTVNPGGQPTTYRVAFDRRDSAFCLDSEAMSASPLTEPQKLADVDAEDHDVSVDLSGLTTGTPYCAAIQAHNDSGTAFSRSIAFGTTPREPRPPTVVIDKATATSAATATVRGTIDPHGQTTRYRVHYRVFEDSGACKFGCKGNYPSCRRGVPTNPILTSADQTLVATDAGPRPVAVSIAGLKSGVEHCASIEATNDSGLR